MNQSHHIHHLQYLKINPNFFSLSNFLLSLMRIEYLHTYIDLYLYSTYMDRRLYHLTWSRDSWSYRLQQLLIFCLFKCFPAARQSRVRGSDPADWRITCRRWSLACWPRNYTPSPRPPPHHAGVLELHPEVHLPAAQPRSSPARLIIPRAVPLLFYSCRPRSFSFFNNWNVPLLCLRVQPRFYLCIPPPLVICWFFFCNPPIPFPIHFPA